MDDNTPLVFFDRICTGINTDRVIIDDYTGAFSAVEYLIKTDLTVCASLVAQQLVGWWTPSHDDHPPPRISRCDQRVDDDWHGDIETRIQ